MYDKDFQRPRSSPSKHARWEKEPHPLAGVSWLIVGPVVGIFAAVAVVLVMKGVL